MRKVQKQQAEELISQMEEAHEQIKLYIEQNSIQLACELLEDCQAGGLTLGTLIENTEGEGHPTVSLLEDYCELIYQIHQKLKENAKENSANKIYKQLRQKLIKVTNSVKNDILIKKEAIFLPYKASMWDSLESVWKAADADPNCNAYVIPIPYFDKNPDGSFREMHYEADLYPDNVPITKYDEFDFNKHRPDMIFIHNPYDGTNFVTSIHPSFYSDKLKKFTKCLVYIPYYVTSGGMGEGRALCPAYIHADYIVIQSEKYRRFFDERIPNEKFLALGSPKFDRVMYKCQHPQELPKEWEERAVGKKIYFYNTSIGGMLGNTEVFLKKMQYVFDIFNGREDACLLWRPHPLLESTFDSMRKQYKPQFDKLKKEFIEKNIGIFDETADIENSIALSDTYIGDAGSSVVSLFGIAGKPIILLNNYINTLPQKEDWRGEWITPTFDVWGNDKYLITKNNQLWISDNNDYHYHFYMDLECEYSGGAYYLKAVEVGNKIYILPYNARHFLVIENNKIRKIELKGNVVHSGSFYGYLYNEKYIFLIPLKYPYLVRINVETEEISYVEGIVQFNTGIIDGEWFAGGAELYENDLILPCPRNNEFLFVNMDTLKVKKRVSHSKSNGGTMRAIQYKDELWALPIKGRTIVCWNLKTNEVKEYNNVPPNFKSIRWPYEVVCDLCPFGNIVFSNESGQENIVISPYWGNMYLFLNRETGELKEWKPPIEFVNRGKNGYFLTDTMGGFPVTLLPQGNAKHRIYYAPERKILDMNIDTKEFQEIEIQLDYEDLVKHESGFTEESEWQQYALTESALNSLRDVLDNKITGSQFDIERQRKAFSKINANTDGTCGKSIYNFMKGRIS